jgi:hypothetical protein
LYVLEKVSNLILLSTGPDVVAGGGVVGGEEAVGIATVLGVLTVPPDPAQAVTNKETLHKAIVRIFISHQNTC